MKIADIFPELNETPEPLIIDRTLAEQYAACPYQGWYSTDHNESVGKLPDVCQELHTVIEETLKEAIEQFIEASSIDLQMTLIDKLLAARPDLQPEVLKAARNVLGRIISAWDGRVLRDSAGHPFIEKQIDCDFISAPSGQPVKLTTCVDLVTVGKNSIHVTDWKGGYKKRTNSEAAESFQAQYISYILWQLYPDVDTIHFWFAETRWGSYAYARFERNAIIIGETTQETAIKARIFEACKLIYADCRDCWPSPEKCAWCDVVLDCPAAQTSSKQLAKDPAKWIDTMAAIKARFDKMRELANEYVKNNGAITGTHTVYDWRPSKSKFTPKLYKLEAEKEGEEQ